MTASSQRLTLKDLRAEAQRLGITTESAGCSIEELLNRARENEDPMAYLTIHAPTNHQPNKSNTEEQATNSLEEADNNHPPADGLADKTEDHPPAPPPSPLVIEIILPVSPVNLEGCYISNHTEVRMNSDQGLTLRRLLLGLDAQGEKLRNGRRIASAADALRWMLEQISSQLLKS
ncbi:MAG TPA: hypothetical protein VIH42_03180 [Thermoguttaceae bacterium]